MGRVLLVDGDASSRALLRDVLVNGGHEVLEAPDGAEAVALASSGVDLVVCDVSPADVSAPDLRRRLRRALASFPVPFVFVSGDVAKDAGTIVELASVEYLFLFHKPPDQMKFSRTIEALIGTKRIVEGVFGDATFDGMLAAIEKGEESGILTAYRGPVVKKVAFENGKVTFCGSNDPRERTGHALIKAGLITEEDLKQALGLQSGSLSNLTVILEKLGKATSKQMDEVVAKKFREAVLDFYLWNDGKWVFQAGAIAVGNPSRLTVDLGPIRAEGAKRAPRWKAVAQMFPTDEIRFDVRKDKFPAGFPGNPGDRKLIDLCSRGMSLGAIRLELAGQDYAVLVRLSELVRQGLLEKGGLPGPGAMEADQIAERAALASAAARSTGIQAPAAMRAPIGAAALAMQAEPEPTLIFESDLVLAPPASPIAAPPPPAVAPPRPPAPPPPPASAPPPPSTVAPVASGERRDSIWTMLHQAEAAAAIREVLGTAAPGVDDKQAIETLMTAAREALEAQDVDRAGRCFQAILKVDPAHPLARRGLAKVDAVLAGRAEGAGLLRSSSVKLARSLDALPPDLDPQRAFVVSRLSGDPLAVEALLSICPLPEAEVLDILRELLAEGWIVLA